MVGYCSVCKQFLETTRSCIKCKCIRYCSKECQRKDWDYHKLYCESFSGFWANQQDKFQKLAEPLSSKMLEFLLTTNENLDKVKKAHPAKSLVVYGCVDRAHGFAYDIKCFTKCTNIFNETELSKIQGIPQSFGHDIDLTVYKLHIDEQNYEIIHVVTSEEINKEF